MSEAETARATSAADPVVKDRGAFDAARPLERELEMSVKDGFTLSAVGDCIITRPLSPYLDDEGFAGIMGVLRDGDVVYGNLETSLIDIDRFAGYPHSWEGDYPLIGHPAVAEDLARLGFGIMSRANNHALDWGIEGMRETSRHLDDAGIVHAGAGEHRGLARAARYLETPQGRVGLVSFASCLLPTSEALPAKDAAPGRPGVSALKFHRKWVVPAAVMAALATIPAPPESAAADAGAAGSGTHAADVPTTLTRFETRFELGDAPGTAYDVDAEDLAGVLKSVRLGKQHADFLIAALHSHQARDERPWPAAPLMPPDCLAGVAHAAVDAGADAFITAGAHNLGPIEVYGGRPVFYGMGNFFWSDLQTPLSAISTSRFWSATCWRERSSTRSAPPTRTSRRCSKRMSSRSRGCSRAWWPRPCSQAGDWPRSPSTRYGSGTASD